MPKVKAPPRPACSHTAISHRTGKPISGIAAMLQDMSDQGGPDSYEARVVAEGIKHAMKYMRNNPKKQLA